MTRYEEAVTMDRLQQIAAHALADGSIAIARAGTATAQQPPQGLAAILRKGGSTGSLGVTGGLVLIKNSAAFTTPFLVMQVSAVRKGGDVQYHAKMQRTRSSDATHACYYPGWGDHVRPGMTQRIGKQTFTHYWRVSEPLSALLRRGEQEHLADLDRAYALTYKLITDTINSMAAMSFGPAPTRQEAENLAKAALAKRLPKQLGANPRNWAAVLDRLLLQTKKRDRSGWHAVTVGPSLTEGSKIIWPLMKTAATRIGSVASSKVVNY
jgi:hypothetical protein